MNGLSRRNFLKAVGLTTGAVALGKLPTMPVAQEALQTPVLASVPSVVTKTSAWIPVTNEALADAVSMEAFINERLREAFDREMMSEVLGA